MSSTAPGDAIPVQGTGANQNKTKKLRALTPPSFGGMPPVVPEPHELPMPDVGTSEEGGRFQLDLRKLHMRTKRVLVRGVLDLEWMSNKQRRVDDEVVRKAFWKHFSAHFPRYLQPARSILTYVPIFREMIDPEHKCIVPSEGRWTITNKEFYVYLRRNAPSKHLAEYTRGMLIHPALGIFPEKDASVFSWDISSSHHTATFNRRRPTQAELNWSAFYPPLARVTIGVMSAPGMIRWTTIVVGGGVSPRDEHGDAYLSVRNVLVGIERILNMMLLSKEEWGKYPSRIRAISANKTIARFTDAQKKKSEPQVARVCELRDMMEGEIEGSKRSSVLCEMRALLDGLVCMDAMPSTTNIRFIDCLDEQTMFRGLTNVWPNTYVLETL